VFVARDDTESSHAVLRRLRVVDEQLGGVAGGRVRAIATAGLLIVA